MYSCSELCLNGTLDPAKVKGKIVLCLRGENARVAKGLECAQAGAVGMILANDAENCILSCSQEDLSGMYLAKSSVFIKK